MRQTLTNHLVLIVTSIFLICHFGYSQPQVPKVIDLADMKLELTDAARKSIQSDVDALHSSPTHLQKRLDVINLYFPIIERIFKEEGVPDDIKYLVIQESGLIADAVSTSNAVGFWQFKDFTAREVGLRVDNQIDERKNIASATRGAAKYLKRNNFQFDNWAYAISAYQAGLGGVRRYVDSKYYGAKKMPITPDTHWYLRKFIAHKVAFENIIGGQHTDGLELVEYTKGGGKDLARIAKDAKVDPELLRYYNKWIPKGTIPTDKEYTVILPVQGKLPKGLMDDKDVITEAETKIEPVAEIKQPQTLNFPDEIKPGLASHRTSVSLRINGVSAILAGTSDNLNSLAAEAGISPDRLTAYNDLDLQSRILPGKVYYIEKKKTKSEIGFHVTESGETLWDIAQQYGVQLEKLAWRNRIDKLEEITIGQVIWLNSRRPKDMPFEYHDVTSNTLKIVKGTFDLHESEIPGDEKLTAIQSVTQLAEKAEETSIDSLEVMNDDSDKTDVDDMSEGVSGTINLSNYEQHASTHKVDTGETLWSISKLYDISVDQIKEWNNLTQYDVLRIGQQLFVQAPILKQKPKREITIYIVRGGDTLYQIASRYEMSVTELMDLNSKQTSELSVGEELKVYRK